MDYIVYKTRAHKSGQKFMFSNLTDCQFSSLLHIDTVATQVCVCFSAECKTTEILLHWPPGNH